MKTVQVRVSWTGPQCILRVGSQVYISLDSGSTFSRADGCREHEQLRLSEMVELFEGVGIGSSKALKRALEGK